MGRTQPSHALKDQLYLKPKVPGGAAFRPPALGRTLGRTGKVRRLEEPTHTTHFTRLLLSRHF